MSAIQGVEGWAPEPGARVVAYHPYSHPSVQMKGARRFLSFNVGQLFVLKKKGSKDWWLAEDVVDPTIAGYIPVNHVGPIQEQTARSWMAGRISRQAAEDILNGPQSTDGSFLVRESEKKAGAFSLSMRVNGGALKHMKIAHTQDVGYELVGVSPLQTPDLEGLLRYYASVPLSVSWGCLVFPLAASPAVTVAAAPAQIRAAPGPPSGGGGPARAAPAPPIAAAAAAPPVAGISPAPTAGRVAPGPPTGLPATAPLATTGPGIRAELTAEEMAAQFAPEQVNSELVQLVRDATSLNFTQARIAAAAVTEYIIGKVDPAMAQAILIAVKGNSEAEALGGADMERLKVIIEELSAMKNDAQQRSWSIYDDAGIIQEYLEEFISIVEDADIRAVTNMIATFQSPGQLGSYEIVETLVVYYQMETRNELRLLMLRLFGAFGSNDPAVFPRLQNGVLPLELARDVMADPWAPENTQRVMYSLLLCTMVFSCGEQLPVTHYDVFNETFLQFLLGLIEHDSETEEQEQISEQAASLLLSFNLHFPKGSSDNLVMRVLSGTTPRQLNQKVMLLMNKDEDPVAVPHLNDDVEAKPAPSSVLKFIHDIFDTEGTASSFFFTNDLNVLIDVLIRELGDREPGDPRLSEYTGVVMGILITQKMIQSEPYRLDELQECLADLKQGLETTAADPALLSIVDELLVSAF